MADTKIDALTELAQGAINNADDLVVVDNSDTTMDASGTTKRYLWSSLLTDVAAYVASLSQTLTNKTIALGSNTVSGTTAQFNTALTDGSFATLAGSETLTNKTLTSPTINTPALGANSVDAIGEIASGLKSGSDSTLITGTAGTNGDLAQWNGDGDLVDGPTPPSGTIVGTTDSQTLTNKTIDGDSNTFSNLDIGNEVDWAAIGDVTDRTAFASGDKLLIFEAGVGLRKIDFDDLPSGGGSGDSWSDPVDADIVPDADGTRDLGSSANRFAELHVDSIDVNGKTITSIAGSDAALLSGTAGTNGDLAQWNGDGDLVDGPTPPSGTIVGTTDTQTLTNKTLTSPVLTTPEINDTSLDHQYIFGVSELTADRTVTLPLLTGNDTFVFNAFAATLTNKTIDGDNNTLSNLDIGNEVEWAAIGDVTDASAFASGDKVLIFEAGVGMRKVDFDDLPSGGGTSNWDDISTNAVELVDGTTATHVHFYNTFTDASNYERGILDWESNVLRIGSEEAGTGSERTISIYQNGLERFNFFSSGSGLSDFLDTARGVFRFRVDGAGTAKSVLDVDASLGQIHFGDNASFTDFHFGQRSVGCTIAHASLVGDTATQTLTIEAQSAVASASTNLDGGIIVIQGGGGASSSSGDADGGEARVIGGDGYGTGDGADVALTPGTANGSGADGRVKFGTHTSIGSETLSGFITIKDSGGTERKVAVVS